jgi:hypothetical protein
MAAMAAMIMAEKRILLVYRSLDLRTDLEVNGAVSEQRDTRGPGRANIYRRSISLPGHACHDQFPVEILAIG